MKTMCRSDLFNKYAKVCLLGTIGGAIKAYKLILGVQTNVSFSFCTYDELLRFKASAAAAAAKMTGIVAPKDGIIQVVADNFDATISSQNGLLNTHSVTHCS
jgi:hypothetical protein